jgi:hypothetical protein
METYTVTVNDNKTIAWRNSNGNLHRKDGPAVEWSDGTKEWYVDGKLHREDGPAIEWSNGTKSWFVDGKRHREDGPAIECANGPKHWYVNGKRHRKDGPAIEWADGTKEWYVDGKLLTREQFLAHTKRKLKQASCAGKVVEVDGKKYKLVEV